jgi:hypothetical protein
MHLRSLFELPMCAAGDCRPGVDESIGEFGVVVTVTVDFPELFNHFLCGLTFASASRTSFAIPVVVEANFPRAMFLADYNSLLMCN